ncbi:uncharacterized protein [Gorilla gorilla gorilla]|uniref:uncharacterized protein isoform X3 n=1 Tax=Gorilla gorilla gorilla TaxID=9595 RepID=UPI00300931E4
MSLPTPAPRDPRAVQGRASCPEARRAKSPLQPAAPELGGAVEEIPLSRRSGDSPAPRIPGWRDASRPRGLVARAGRRTRRRALPGLAWACSEPGCFSMTTQIGGIWRFCGSPAAKLRGRRGLEACTTCSPRPSVHPGAGERQDRPVPRVPSGCRGPASCECFFGSVLAGCCEQ